MPRDAVDNEHEETTAMNDIILHHYEFSTFSEKVRLALGLKGLAYRSVDIPGLPPRPLLEPLTGGYRRAPVLQIGADITATRTSSCRRWSACFHHRRTRAFTRPDAKAWRAVYRLHGTAPCGFRRSAC